MKSTKKPAGSMPRYFKCMNQECSMKNYTSFWGRDEPLEDFDICHKCLQRQTELKEEVDDSDYILSPPDSFGG